MSACLVVSVTAPPLEHHHAPDPGAPVAPLAASLSNGSVGGRSRSVPASTGGVTSVAPLSVEQLYQRYRNSLIAYVRNMLRGDAQSAEGAHDVVQTVFLRAWKHRETLARMSTLAVQTC